jgi:hypothetical protein
MIKTVKLAALIVIALSGNTFIASGARASVFPTQHPPGQTKATDPTAGVLYYGGPVISNAQIYLILWGAKVSTTTTAAMPDFYASMVNSNYMDFLKIYNTTGLTAQDGTHTGTNQSIGHGTFLQTIQIAPAKLSGTIDDLEIQAELEGQIAAGKVPAQTANSLYMIHFPKGLKITMHDGTTVATSCQQFCAFHNGFQPKKGSAIYYGVIPDLDSLACSLGCGSGGSLARITTSASHEMIEAITDPIPTPGSNPAFPQAWNTKDGQEIGDLCQSNTASLVGHNATYQVQQEWDNSLGGCTTGDYQAN